MNQKFTVEDINQKIADIKTKIEEIDKYKNIKDKVILLLSLIDSYSQMNVFYSGSQKNNKNSAQKFTEFVTEFYPQKFWNDIGFVNLSHEFNNGELKNFYDEIGRILTTFSKNSLNDFSVNSDVIKLIKNMGIKLENKYVGKDVKKNIEKYKYKNLIYKYRCKLVHMYSFPGIAEDFESIANLNQPCYIIGVNGISNKIKNKYDLIFPYEFIKELTFNSIKNYLERCLKENKYPYSNYKEWFTWYE